MYSLSENSLCPRSRLKLVTSQTQVRRKAKGANLLRFWGCYVYILKVNYVCVICLHGKLLLYFCNTFLLQGYLYIWVSIVALFHAETLLAASFLQVKM